LSPKLISSILAVCLTATVAALWVLPASAKHGATRATTVTVTAGKPSEFGFKLSKKTFPHGAVTFKVTNGGILPHDFKICASAHGSTAANSCTGKKTAQLTPGGAAKTLTFTFKTKGTYEYLCTVSGHAAAGMKGTVKVT
jgi:uncharacterized cupredoxin-like copper-binding protein